MGKKTYDWVMRQNLGEFPYKGKTTFDFSSIKQLKNTDGKNIWLVGGGDLVQFFVQAKLIDEIIITIAPTLLDKVSPLFNKQDVSFDLELKGVRNFNQFVE